MRFVFTCGGTAGHINPALAVAGRLRELLPDSEFLFLGAEGKMEMQLVPMAGYDIKPLKITNISRGKSLKALVHNIQTVKNVAGATRETKKILKDFKPDVVIGTGGYVCYPVLMAASKLHIPTAVHESNAVPGLTTKMLSTHVDKIMVGFEESRQYYKNPERVEVTGTPVRGEFSCYTKDSAKAQLGLPADKPLVVSVWGSLGAGHMNKIVTEMIPKLRGQDDFRLIHSAGSMYYKDVCEKLSETAPYHGDYGVDVKEYIYDMPRVMAAADLIMCRAGASTLAELTYMGKPVIIVPSPNVTNNHQEKNARLLEARKGAVVMVEKECSAEKLYAEIKTLLADPDRRTEMGKNLRQMVTLDRAERICDIVEKLAK